MSYGVLLGDLGSSPMYLQLINYIHKGYPQLWRSDDYLGPGYM